MDTLETIRICTAYELDGKTLDHPPLGADALERCVPVYEEMPGWQTNTAGMTEHDALPEAAQAYLQRLQALAEVPIHLVSTGPDRAENVIVEWPFGALPGA